MALPHMYMYKEIKEVLYTTNFIDNDVYSIRKLINIFSPFQIKLHVTHFNLDDDRDTDESKMFQLHESLANDYKDVRIDFEIIDSHKLREAFNEYMVNRQLDMISLTTRSISNFKRLFKQSTATDILYHTNIPLIVFHGEE